MDFLERLFHLSPDAGSGSTEALIVGCVAFVAAYLVRRWTGRRIHADYAD